jgi:peptide deformylase
MAKLVAENHLALHSMAEEVTPEEFTNGSVKKLVKKMREALHSYNVDGYVGVAIAAPQIGIAKRIFLVEDQSKDREDALPSLVAINPMILKASRKKVVVGEGCLSVPDRYGAISRHASVTLKATDENGEEFERGAGGLLAQIFQHECDHLDGTLFVDRAEKIWTKEEADKLSLSEAKD